MTWRKVWNALAPRSCAARAVVGRKLDQVGVDRQRQQHDEEMDEADHRGETRVEAISSGSAIRPEPSSAWFTTPVLPEHQKPGVGPHDVGRPERQDRQQQRQPLPARGHPEGDDPGQRIGEETEITVTVSVISSEFDDSAPEVRLFGEDADVVAEVEAPDELAPVDRGEAHRDHHEETGRTKKAAVQRSAGATKAPAPAVVSASPRGPTEASRARGPASRCRARRRARVEAARGRGSRAAGPSAASPSARRVSASPALAFAGIPQKQDEVASRACPSG
jgi:hypothetical protein